MPRISSRTQGVHSRIGLRERRSAPKFRQVGTRIYPDLGIERFEPGFNADLD
jgi:hypothetical protein